MKTIRFWLCIVTVTVHFLGVVASSHNKPISSKKTQKIKSFDSSHMLNKSLLVHNQKNECGRCLDCHVINRNGKNKKYGPGEIANINTSCKVGIAHKISDKSIQERWGGIQERTLPEAVAGNVMKMFSRTAYEELFPNRYGLGEWRKKNPMLVAVDYYSYRNFIEAIKELAKFKVKIETKNYSTKISRLDKTTKEEMLLKIDKSFTADWLKNVKPSVTIIDYGCFLNEAAEDLRKRELAAFLANIAHETSGGVVAVRGGRYSGGLFFKEEVGWNSKSVGSYSLVHKDYPPKPGTSYHGRGPLQLSWNYNYGYLSQIIFGDKRFLLEHPEKVAENGKLGFISAIWFWMMPQKPKPSCHDVIIGMWKPSAADKVAARLPGFGTVINIINGGLEAGVPNDFRVKDRIGFYVTFCKKMHVNPGSNLHCYSQKAFA